MTYNELMNQFGKTVGLEDFTPNENGICEIYSEEGTVTFQYVPEAEVVLMTAPVCVLGDDPTPAFLRTFLEANFMYQKTRGSTLSIDPTTNCVMLSRYDRLGDLTVERLAATVESMVTALIEWRSWYKEDEGVKDADATAVEDYLKGNMII